MSKSSTICRVMLSITTVGLTIFNVIYLFGKTKLNALNYAMIICNISTIILDIINWNIYFDKKKELE